MKSAHRLAIQDNVEKNWKDAIEDATTIRVVRFSPENVKFEFLLPKEWFSKKLKPKTENRRDLERSSYFVASARPLTDKLKSFARRFRDNDCLFAFILETDIDVETPKLKKALAKLKKISSAVGIVSRVKAAITKKKFFAGAAIFFNADEAEFEEWNLPRRFGLFAQRGLDLLVAKGRFRRDPTTLTTFLVCVSSPPELRETPVIDEALREATAEIRLKFGRCRVIVGGNFASADIAEFFRANVEFREISIMSGNEILLTNFPSMFDRQLRIEGPLMSVDASTCGDDVVFGSIDLSAANQNSFDMEAPVSLEDDLAEEDEFSKSSSLLPAIVL